MRGRAIRLTWMTLVALLCAALVAGAGCGGGLINVPPNLLSPKEGSILDVDEELKFEWSDVEWAERYHIQVATSDLFKPLDMIIDEFVPYSYYPYSQIHNKRKLAIDEYFWRVKSANGTTESEWSEIATFVITGTIVATPTPTCPFGNKPNKEAEEMALYLSGNLTAPDELYEQVRSDLAAIRYEFFGNGTGIEFTPPWILGEFFVSFNDTEYQMIVNETYDAWDELNSEYAVVVDNIYKIIPTAYLVSECRWHPVRLAELYENLPGVKHVAPSRWAGDFSNIYPRQTGNGITYLFRWGSGDCPMGCINNHYSYFVFKDGEPISLGHYDPSKDPKPDWWDEASKNRDRIMDGN